MLFINLILLGLFIIFYLISKKYEIDLITTLEKKEHPLIFLYPMSLYLMDKVKRIVPLKEKEEIKDNLVMLHIGADKEILTRFYYCKKVGCSIFFIILFLILSLCYSLGATGGDLINGKYLERPDYGEDSKEINLNVVIEDEKEYVETEINLELGPRKYEEKDIIELINNAKKYIDANVLGKNRSVDEVLYDLNFMKSIPGYNITLKWEVGNNLIDSSGEVYNEEIEEGVLTEITSTITYYDTKADYTFFVNVMPRVISNEETLIEGLNESVEEASSRSPEDRSVELPENVGQAKVYYGQDKDSTGTLLMIFGVIVASLVYFLLDGELNQKIQKRNVQLAIDYPEIINKFTLLLGAGMTMKSAWGKIAEEYENKLLQGKSGHRYAYDEMLITWHELKVGISEVKAFENYGKRIKLLPYLKFSSLIAQNIKKGSSGLLELLELEGINAFEERKELAKRLGEEAGTKLLMPMMIMLVIVLVIIMVPALLTLGL